MGDDNQRWPVARWMHDNRALFFRKMPLSAFLHALPVWLLYDVIHPEKNPDPDLSPPLYLAVLHLSLWSESGDVEITGAELGRAREAFEAAAELELGSRLGVFRYNVQSPDRLLRAGRLDVETNPVILGILRPPLPRVDDPAWEEQFIRAAQAGTSSGWGEPSALREYLERAKARPVSRRS